MPTLSVNMNAEALRTLGPSTNVVVIGPDGVEHEALAQIDTGANHTCVGPLLAARLGAPIGVLNQQAAGTEAVNVPVYRCGLRFPNGTQLQCDFAILPHLSEPHDVLVGRDILSFCRIEVDFVNGGWKLHFKTT